MYEPTQTPLFVLSSGRAGSTLLARMLHRHPDLLCVSDLFEPVGEEPYFDAEHVVSGAEFLEVLSRPSLPDRIRYWRSRPTDELLYLPPDDEDVSLLMSYTLPFLTGGDPSELYEQLREAVAGFPPAPMPQQLLRFFDWLRDRFGQQRWVERTGGSLPHTERFLETWPEGRYVHSYRDPRETAISMMTGSFFRLYLELERDPDLERWDWSRTPPLEEMGAMLNRWVVNATEALAEVPAERRFDLPYEALMEDATGTLLELARFLLERETTPEDEAWAERQAERIRPAPLRFPELPVPERDRLEAACADAIEALDYRLAVAS